MRPDNLILMVSGDVVMFRPGVEEDVGNDRRVGVSCVRSGAGRLCNFLHGFMHLCLLHKLGFTGRDMAYSGRVASFQLFRAC
jgi:hypothetical protein